MVAGINGLGMHFDLHLVVAKLIVCWGRIITDYARDAKRVLLDGAVGWGSYDQLSVCLGSVDS